MVFSAIIACTFYYFTTSTPLPDPWLAKTILYSAAAILLTGMTVACFCAYANLTRAIITITVTTWLFLTMTLAAIPSIDARSIYPFAVLLKPILTPQDEIITFNQYYQDLPFYLQRRVTILNWQNELRFGMQHQDTRTWMINDNTFWQRWHSHKRVFVIMDLRGYYQFKHSHPNENIYLLGTTINNALISNRANGQFMH